MMPAMIRIGALFLAIVFSSACGGSSKQAQGPGSGGDTRGMETDGAGDTGDTGDMDDDEAGDAMPDDFGSDGAVDDM
jgi:hypothetical protein